MDYITYKYNIWFKKIYSQTAKKYSYYIQHLHVDTVAYKLWAIATTYMQ